MDVLCRTCFQAGVPQVEIFREATAGGQEGKVRYADGVGEEEGSMV